MKKVLIILWCFLLFPAVHAQFFQEAAMPQSTEAGIVDSKMGIRLHSYSFFKNNEYFHPLAEGYTLPGFIIQPRFYYELNEKFTLETGVHLSQFFGKKGLNSVDPLFRATYTPTRKFSVLLGWLKGTSEHQLIEPLYQWEKMYTQPLEYGVQFLVNNAGFKLDTWLNWEKYIEFNDPFQEELTFGTTSKTLLLQKGNLQLWIPAQITARHIGGQVTITDEPLKTFVNWAAGINIRVDRPQSVIQKVMLDFYYTGYSDFSPQKKQAFKNGFGLYPVISANIQDFHAALGYWSGHQFISPLGEPLFQSVSPRLASVVYPDRNMITFKGSYLKPIFKNVSFAAYLESYYDVRISQLDYSYGISISLTGDFLLKHWQSL